jgi:ABC-type uncharacterized transport system auxiliary subunit
MSLFPPRRCRALFAALLLALALAGCGPEAPEIHNTNRGINGSSMVHEDNKNHLGGDRVPGQAAPNH